MAFQALLRNGLITRQQWKRWNSSSASSSSQLFKLKILTTESGVPKRNVKSIIQTGKPDEQVRVQGWVRALRKQKHYVFLDLDDGSTCNRIPVILKATTKPPDLTLYSSIDVTGVLKPTIRDPSILELHPLIPVTVLGTCDNQKYPLGGKIRYDQDHLRQHPHLRFKTSKFASLLRLRSAAATAIHDYFTQNDFLQIHTPMITGNDCEGAGEVFTVKPFSDKLIQEMMPSPLTEDPAAKSREPEEAFFNKRAFLTVSSQLHLEAAVGGLEKVWTMSPVFRAENAQSTRHLAEFYMVEAELAFAYEIQEILTIMEGLIKFVLCRLVFDHHFAEWKFSLVEKHEERKIDFENIVRRQFTVMTFEEAQNLLASKLGSIVPRGQGLSREQELQLVKLNDSNPIFLINWPKEIKPFYMRECIDNPNLVSAVDLLMPDIGELCGGSLRENDLGLLETKLLEVDPSGKTLDSMSWYLDLRRFGGVASGGFGLGFDRLLQFILGHHNIKDVTPFPRWPHNCPM